MKTISARILLLISNAESRTIPAMTDMHNPPVPPNKLKKTLIPTKRETPVINVGTKLVPRAVMPLLSHRVRMARHFLLPTKPVIKIFLIRPVKTAGIVLPARQTKKELRFLTAAKTVTPAVNNQAAKTEAISLAFRKTMFVRI